MLVKARLQNLRIAARKVRLAVDLIRGKDLEKAKALLTFTTKKASEPLLKLLKQAEANAKNNLHLDPANLFVAEVLVNEGRKLKRWRPRARGQAYEIQKKTSHVLLVLDEIKKTAGRKKAKSLKEELPVKAEEVTKGKEEKTKFKSKVKEDKSSFPPFASARVIKKLFQRKVY